MHYNCWKLKVIKLYGSGVFSRQHFEVSFSGTSVVKFIGNEVRYGEAIYSRSYSKIYINGHQTVMHKDNRVSESIGAVYTYMNCNITFSKISIH